VAKESAGILLWRRRNGDLEVFLVHPGGPYWAKKDHGAWSIPKGELGDGESALDAAVRELHEETGVVVASSDAIALPSVKQRGGKVVHAFAVEGDCDPASIVSSTFSIEWPPRSGTMAEFPEVDRAAWFSIDEARVRMLASQQRILDELVSKLERSGKTAMG